MATPANPAVTTEATVKCPYCAEVIVATAKKCKHCGEFLDQTLRQERTPRPVPQQKTWNPGTAAVLSFIIPGTGQMYKGRILAGLVWLVGVAVGYVAFVVPGVILHIGCVYNAYSYDPTKTSDAKPLAGQPAPVSNDRQKSVLYKAGRGWGRMTTATTQTDKVQPSVFCSSCGKYTTSRTASCNRCGKRLR
jgi:TM2 domain-containing membrane protein YozV